MASSIHIQRAKNGSIIHNSRENFSQSVVFDDEVNEISCNSKEAFELYRSELAKRSEAYTKRVKQKLQKNAITLLSAVVNLEQHHALKDLDKIVKHLEKTLDTKVVQKVIHRDEGKLVLKEDEDIVLTSGHDFFKNPEDEKLYFDKKYTKEIDLSKYEIKKNYHAHIEMMGIDSNGNGIKRNRLSDYYLSNLQTVTAHALYMQRGGVSNKRHAKELNVDAEKSKKRLDVFEYKKANTHKRAIQKDLKVEINRLRDELKATKQAKQEDYAKLNKLNKDLKEQIKAKELSVEDLETKVKDLEEQLRTDKKQIQELESREPVVEKKELDNADVKSIERKIEKQMNRDLKEVLVSAKADTSINYSISSLVNFFKNTYTQFRNKITSLTQENTQLKAENKQLKEENESLQIANQEKQLKSFKGEIEPSILSKVEPVTNATADEIIEAVDDASQETNTIEVNEWEEFAKKAAEQNQEQEQDIHLKL